MERLHKERYKILIVDDSELNREILSTILEDRYEIMEAGNGLEAIAVLEQHVHEIALIFLDIMMPEADGFDVLACMNKYHWIEDVPVIMISAEHAPSYVDRAYEFGAADFISRPFDASIVRRRAANMITLYAKKRRLADIVAQQIYEREKSNSRMITILSQIVEFRNGESGQHVLHIRTLTELLLKRLLQKTDQYPLSASDISRIGTASALHDIGKISIPDEILNKPGRLTAEEFQIMKTHARAGADMLENVPGYEDDALFRTAYEICRWHHERYDGRGYPDGLTGDEIPLSAQIVSLADVYDALTSERCYKKAFSHEKALQMILNGECGVFHPLLLECLLDIQGELQKELRERMAGGNEQSEVRAVTAELLQREELTASAQMFRQLESERIRASFFEAAVSDITFSYYADPPLLVISPEGAKLLGLEETIVDPLNSRKLRGRMNELTVRMSEKAHQTTALHPFFHATDRMMIGGEERLCSLNCQAIWISTDPPQYTGVVGRIMDIETACGRIAEGQAEALKETLDICRRHMHKENGDDILWGMSGQQIWIVSQYLGIAFDMIRLVDRDGFMAYTVGKDGRLEKAGGCCYKLWHRERPCENCIAANVLSTKERLTKFEFVDDDIYHMVAMYVEVDGLPYALEMLTRISDETLLGGYGRKELVDTISRHNERLYIDPVTGAYNRRYYEEQIHGLVNISAVAILDVDNFKQINDSFGHQTGDEALHLITEEIRSCIRRSDTLIRYGGDEFLLIFRIIPEHIFRRKLEQIRKQVSNLRVGGDQSGRISVSIGGKYGPGAVKDMLPDADRLMYCAKIGKNQVKFEAD